MVHEQNFKDHLSSTCQLSRERRVLDLESGGQGSIPTVGNILSLDFFLFSRSKDENARIRGFHKLDEFGNNVNIGIRGFIYYVKKIQWQNVTLIASHSLWFQVQHSPFYTNLVFACETETLGSLYSYALLIPTKSSKSKIKWCMNRSLKISHVTHDKLV